MESKITEGEKPTNCELNPSIRRAFMYGQIGMVGITKENDFNDRIKTAITEGLGPIGLDFSFFDLQNLPTQQVKDRLKGPLMYGYIKDPKWIFKDNSINVIYGWRLEDVDRVTDESQREKLVDQNARLAYLIDYWAGGSGFLQKESGDRYRSANVHVLLIVNRDQWRSFWKRGYSNRDIYTVPFQTLLESDSDIYPDSTSS